MAEAATAAIKLGAYIGTSAGIAFSFTFIFIMVLCALIISRRL